MFCGVIASTSREHAEHAPAQTSAAASETNNLMLDLLARTYAEPPCEWCAERDGADRPDTSASVEQLPNRRQQERLRAGFSEHGIAARVERRLCLVRRVARHHHHDHVA